MSSFSWRTAYLGGAGDGPAPAGEGPAPAAEERDPFLDDLEREPSTQVYYFGTKLTSFCVPKLTQEHNEEEEEVNYVHQVVSKYMKGKDGEKRAAELKGTLSKHLEHHLPAAATDREVREWLNYDAMRTKFIDDKVKEEMARRLAATPKASDKTKHDLKLNVIKRCTEAYDSTQKPPVFQSRLAHATASVVTYDSTKLRYAEIVLSQSC
ncbi:uncharacterized protein MELLADRAFT_70054 [Melampsora larici-populina 98AG31]|uniref:Uncharacterized protein n=1 Tax=Melampsora larici-populina (strain 98AG31 / pathotype 3-4-7) TaxID=747676 RepID=F4SDC9_MELLP|nr:uncharacterized protein MELLADRAFT_70054 [Melampsora larici-populina 98AG31]EGF97347.1 hypothetical protein MELLADRAFT_70054 [Melampsora larici-populina 98AG31]